MDPEDLNFYHHADRRMLVTNVTEDHLRVAADYFKEHWTPEPPDTPVWRTNWTRKADLLIRKSPLPYYTDKGDTEADPDDYSKIMLPFFSLRMLAMLNELGIEMARFGTARRVLFCDLHNWD